MNRGKFTFSILVGVNVFLFVVGGIGTVLLGSDSTLLGFLSLCWLVSLGAVAVWGLVDFIQYLKQKRQPEESTQLGWKPPKPQQKRNTELRQKRLIRRRRRKRNKKK
jgi:hypothetical protein